MRSFIRGPVKVSFNGVELGETSFPSYLVVFEETVGVTKETWEAMLARLRKKSLLDKPISILQSYRR